MAAASNKEEEIIWLAGLLEGEGYFRFCFGTGRSRTNTQLGIVLQMVDKDVVEHAARVMGAASVRWRKGATENRKDTYRTQVCASRAAYIMKAILPYMGARRRLRIEDILKKWEMMREEKTASLFAVA